MQQTSVTPSSTTSLISKQKTMNESYSHDQKWRTRESRAFHPARTASSNYSRFWSRQLFKSRPARVLKVLLFLSPGSRTDGAFPRILENGFSPLLLVADSDCGKKGSLFGKSLLSWTTALEDSCQRSRCPGDRRKVQCQKRSVRACSASYYCTFTTC